MIAARAVTVFSVCAGLLGFAHLALTPLAHPEWSLEALWFAGTGLAIVVVAIFNWAGRSLPERSAALALVAANLAMTAFFAAAWTVLPGPQVIAGGAIFAGLALCTVIRRAVPVA
jgi:hypothetical protein